MVKGVATSIITVAVLMGSVVACSGSDSEVAELREELEDLKEQLDTEGAIQSEKTPVPPTPVPPTPIPLIPLTPTPQTFFEYPEYGISVDFSTDEGADRLLALTQCKSDWNTLLRAIEEIENKVMPINDGGEGLFDLRLSPSKFNRLSVSDFDYLIMAFNVLTTTLLQDEGGIIQRMGNCSVGFMEIFDSTSGNAALMLLNFIDKCAELKNRDTYTAAKAESDYFLAVWFKNTCYSLLNFRLVLRVNERFEDLTDWAMEIQAERGER